GVRARFLGPLTHDAVLQAKRGARVVVLPAVVAADGDRDVLPTVLLEAQALGRPVVSTRLTGIPEIVAEGETGVLVAARDPARLVAGLVPALEQWLTDPELAARMGAAGRRRMAERFQITNGVAALAE